MKVCPKCGKELKDNAKFCGYCGFSFKEEAEEDFRICPKCHRKLKPQAKFCGYCGYSFPEEVQTDKEVIDGPEQVKEEQQAKTSDIKDNEVVNAVKEEAEEKPTKVPNQIIEEKRNESENEATNVVEEHAEEEPDEIPTQKTEEKPHEDVVVCPSCHKNNKPKAKFCAYCGASLKEEKSGEEAQAQTKEEKVNDAVDKKKDEVPVQKTEEKSNDVVEEKKDESSNQEVEENNGFWAKRIKENDQEAIESLIHETEKEMFSIAYQYVHDQDDANILVHDTYRYNFQKIDQLKDDSKIRAWLARSLINRCKDYLKKKKREVVMSDLDDAEYDTSFVDNIESERVDFNPVEKVGQELLKEGLMGCLNELSDAQRSSLIMTQLHGMSYAEAAEALEMNENTVKSNVRYAKTAVKKKIEQMRKENKSFYGVAPLPFLANMLDQQAESMLNLDVTQLAQEIVGTAPVAATAATTEVAKNVAEQVVSKPAVSQAAKVASTKAAAAGGISKIISTKAIIGLVSAVAVGAASFGGYTILSQRGQQSNTGTKEIATTNKQTTTKNNQTTSSKPTNDSSSGNDAKETKEKKSYDSLLDDYWNGMIIGVVNSQNKNRNTVALDSMSSISLDKSWESESYVTDNMKAYGYAFKDLNNDGKPELLVGKVDGGKNGEFLNAYALDKDNKPQLLQYTSYDGSSKKATKANIDTQDSSLFHLGKKGNIYYIGSDKTISKNTLDGTELKNDGLYASNGEYVQVEKNNEKKISEDQYTKVRDTMKKDVQSIDYKPFTTISDKKNAQIQKSGLAIKDMNTTLKIPAMFKYAYEGKVYKQPKYSYKFALDGNNETFKNYEGDLTVTKVTPEQEVNPEMRDAYINPNTMSEEKQRLKEMGASDTQFYGTENKYVAIIHNSHTGDSYEASFQVLFNDLNSKNSIIVSVSLQQANKGSGELSDEEYESGEINDGTSVVLSKKEYEELYNAIVEMVKNSGFLS